MFALLHLALASEGLHPATVALARAVEAYSGGRRGEAAERLRALTEARPWDDDAHWWLARVEVDAGRFAEALELLEGRTGRGVPLAEFRALRGVALLALGDAAGAQEVVDALSGLRTGRLRREALAALGVTLAARDENARAAGALVQAGGDPVVVMGSALIAALPLAEELLAVEVRAGLPDRSVQVERGGERWRVELDSGLARRLGPASDRGERAPCGDGEVWTVGPGEGLAGVYRSGGGDTQRVARTPLGLTDLSPTCDEDAVWFVRRGPGVQEIHRRGVAEELRAWERGTLAAIDAGEEGLLVGAVVEGEPVAWLVPELDAAPRRLWDSALSFGVPRW